jgi:hypothetical protein
MKITATPSQFTAAEMAIESRYGGNVYTERTRSGNFRLRVHSSRGPGSRKAADGRRISAACWHAFGHYLDALGDAHVIIPGYRGPACRHGWVDRNIGSQARPFMYSEACDCEK